jgi:hypothetical protein
LSSLSGFLKERHRKIPFKVSLALLLATSLLAFLTPAKLLPLLAIVVTIVFIYVAGFRQLLPLTKYFLLFVIPLVIASLLLQVIVGAIDFALIVTTFTKVYTLYTVSSIVMKSFSTREFISLFRKLKFKPLIVVLLTLKLTYYSASILTDVLDVYKVNMGHLRKRGFLCRAMLSVIQIKAFVQLFTVKALEVGEAMYTRYKKFVG